jgi:hypothetical protein
MITVHLPKIWMEQLVNLPESGMGYQRVDILLRQGEVLKSVMVFNAEECQVPKPFNPSDIVDVRLVRG